MKKVGKIFLILVVLGGVFFLGTFFGSEATSFARGISWQDSRDSASESDIELFWEAWGILENRHVETNNVVDEDKIFSAIEGLARAYDDPYTVFFPPEESEEFQTEISGEFSGVGMEVGMEDSQIVVVAPLKESPAEKAGMRSQDAIIAIDGESTFGLSIGEAVDKIRGPKGVEVVLSVVRKDVDEIIDIPIVRDTIDFPSIETEEIDDVFVIHLYNFNENATEHFVKAYSEFIASGKKDLILDLRQNPGGFLNSSIDIASLFLPKGQIVVQESFSQTSGRRDTIYRSSGNDSNIPDDFSMVVLIDEGSASASEILAGALKEQSVATLLGKKTFGKGSVQELISLNKETSIKVTIAKWLTPEGNSIDKNGLEPDYYISFNPEKYIEDGSDSQIDAAVLFLKGENIESEPQDIEEVEEVEDQTNEEE